MRKRGSLSCRAGSGSARQNTCPPAAVAAGNCRRGYCGGFPQSGIHEAVFTHVIRKLLRNDSPSRLINILKIKYQNAKSIKGLLYLEVCL